MENVQVNFRVFQKIDFRSLLGFIISGVLLWLTFHSSGLQLKDISIHGTQWYYFGAAIIAFVVATWVQSVRAKLLWINETQKGHQVNTYSSLIIGNFYNALLPGNLGDGIRAWHFSRKQRVPFSSSMAAVLTEKWIDAQMFIGLTIILFLLKPFTNHYIFWAICNTSLLVMVLSAVYALMLRYKKIEKFIWRVVIRLRKPGRFLFRLYKYATWQMRAIKTNGAIPQYVLFCAITLILNVAQFLFLLKTSGISGPVLSIYTAYLMAVSMMIIAIIPSAPGNIGVMHYGIYVVLILSAQQYGVKLGSAELQAYAVLGIYTHLSYLLPELFLGGIYAVAERKILFEPKLSLQDKSVAIEGKSSNISV